MGSNLSKIWKKFVVIWGQGIIPTKEQRFSITSYISLKGVTYVFCIHKSLHNRMVYLFTRYMKMSHQLFVELSFEGWPLPNFKQKNSRSSTCWTHASSSNCRRHWSQHPKTHGLSEPKAPKAPQKICIYLAKLWYFTTRTSPTDDRPRVTTAEVHVHAFGNQMTSIQSLDI